MTNKKQKIAKAFDIVHLFMIISGAFAIICFFLWLSNFQPGSTTQAKYQISVIAANLVLISLIVFIASSLASAVLLIRQKISQQKKHSDIVKNIKKDTAGKVIKQSSGNRVLQITATIFFIVISGFVILLLCAPWWTAFHTAVTVAIVSIVCLIFGVHYLVNSTSKGNNNASKHRLIGIVLICLTFIGATIAVNLFFGLL